VEAGDLTYNGERDNDGAAGVPLVQTLDALRGKARKARKGLT